MEPMQNILGDKVMEVGHQNQLNLELSSSYVISFPHTTESLSVYSLQNISTSMLFTLRRKDVPHK